MKFLIILTLCLPLFCIGSSIPFNDDIESALSSDDYIKTTPYSKEEIMSVREKLNLSREYDPRSDEYLTVPELITKYGYPVEEHFTKTKDGYILRMHRIPPTKKGIAPCNRTVFLMHGIIMSSADWIILGPKKAFAYHLADLGYDVWMGNARGNTQSRNHTRWNPRHRKFWKFSWHEIGTRDLPAMIDYVLKTTKQKALYHVGHSQGTTTFYVMCSELPKYNKKIIAHYSLAPIAFMNHAFSPVLRIAAKFSHSLGLMTRLLGMNELMPHNALMTWMGNKFCDAGERTAIICKLAIFSITGFDQAEFNDTLLPTIMGHTPAGSSARQMIHYAQLMNSGKFRKYDHAPFNGWYYGLLHSIWPPRYNLKKVKAPVYLYYSRNDWLSHEKDVTKLCKKLGNCKAQTLVAERRFNHMDYLLGMHAKERIYSLVTADIVNHLPKKEQLGAYLGEEEDNDDEEDGEEYDDDDDDDEDDDDDHDDDDDDDDDYNWGEI